MMAKKTAPILAAPFFALRPLSLCNPTLNVSIRLIILRPLALTFMTNLQIDRLCEHHFQSMHSYTIRSACREDNLSSNTIEPENTIHAMELSAFKLAYLWARKTEHDNKMQEMQVSLSNKGDNQ